MKILSVVPSYYPAKIYGGTIFSIHETNNQICKTNSKIKINVLTTTANGDKRLNNRKNKLINYLSNYSVFYCFDEIINRFSFSFLINLKKRLKNVDLVHLQDIFSYFAILTLIFSGIYKKKLIISPRGSLSNWSLRSKFFILKKIIVYLFLHFKKDIHWHVTSNFEKKDLINLGIKKNIHIVENFSFKPVYAKLKKKWWLNKEDKKKTSIGFLGRLDKKKGIDILIDCFVKAKIKNITLSIAGGSKKEVRFFQKQLDKYKSKNIYFLGHIDKSKFNYLSSLDYFIMLSKNENFGNVYLEALNVGTPIITSKFTPFKNIARHNSGFVLDMNSKKIISFFEKLDKSQNNKIKVSKKYLSKFDKKKIIHKFNKLYKKIYLA